MQPYLEQAGFAAVFYLLIIVLFRISGKRLAGQTTTFDLVILISLSVAIQRATLSDGVWNTVVFMAVVLSLHHLQTRLCLRSEWFRNLVRGTATVLVRDGQVDTQALQKEGLSLEELSVGLRKAGLENPQDAKVAHLEETGHITVVKGE